MGSSRTLRNWKSGVGIRYGFSWNDVEQDVHILNTERAATEIVRYYRDLLDNRTPLITSPCDIKLKWTIGNGICQIAAQRCDRVITSLRIVLATSSSASATVKSG
jgi:hypothetical protein